MSIISKYQTWSPLIDQRSHRSITSIHISTEDDIIILLMDTYETVLVFYSVVRSFWARFWHYVDLSRVLLLVSKAEQNKLTLCSRQSSSGPTNMEMAGQGPRCSTIKMTISIINSVCIFGTSPSSIQYLLPVLGQVRVAAGYAGCH